MPFRVIYIDIFRKCFDDLYHTQSLLNKFVLWACKNHLLSAFSIFQKSELRPNNKTNSCLFQSERQTIMQIIMYR